MRTKPPRTKHARIAGDLAEKLSEIITHERVSSSAVLDPLIRSHIEARFNKLPKAFRDRALARIDKLSD